MVHNNTSLVVSENEAARVDDEAKRRLLAAEKLILVVDLDQTIIHATVDPTVADWQKDDTNPNHEAVKEVRSFLLKDEGIGRGGSGCWYYIKLRPGLKQFLDAVSEIYELHIYTMGTRQYAKNIADIIDPDRKIFGDRILSRDESGSMTAKNLQRLFPVDTKMVVIIDDRGDVWKWSPNLIKVTPYDFFVGIGDINSSFLPKKPELRAATSTSPKPIESAASKEPNGDSTEKSNGLQNNNPESPPNANNDSPVDTKSSPLDHLVAMSAGDGSTNRDEQANSQDEALTVQLEEKPLLQKQKQLEADDAARLTTTKALGNESDVIPDEPEDAERPRHSLLRDNDRELHQLEDSLRSVHAAFFRAYSQRFAAAQGGRLGKLIGGQKQKSPTDKSDLDLIPDIKTILPAVKSKVLGGTVLVFSGIVPLGLDVASTDIAILAKSFGAVIHDDVSRSTTHVVAARNRTQKVRAAARRGKGRVRIVSPQWLLDSIGLWHRQDENTYLLDVEESRNGSFHDDDILSESESDGSELGEGSESDSAPSRERPSLSITVKPLTGSTDEVESDAEGILPSELEVDDKSPVGGTNEDWNAMNKELEDFLGSEMEGEDGDDGAESEASTSSKISIRGRKRARGAGGEEESDSGSDRDAQRRQAKKRIIAGRPNAPTSLSQSALAAEHGNDTDDNDSVVSRNGNKDRSTSRAASGVRAGDGKTADGEEPKEGDGWSDFEEDDFEAELERAASEEKVEEGG